MWQVPINPVSQPQRTACSGGRSYASSGTSGGTISQGQSYKYYLKVTGNPRKCLVRVTRFRAWAEGKELESVADSYAQEHVWDLFFHEIDEKLKDPVANGSP